LMRALANLVSNSHRHTTTGGVRLTLRREGTEAVIDIADTGCGIPSAIAGQLMRAVPSRVFGTERYAGSGSGFRSARQIIESLGGSLEITATGETGTTLQVRLCCAYRAVTPCTASELEGDLDGRSIIDFDRRPDFEAGMAAISQTARRGAIAVTYDNTSATRARLSQSTGMMLIKPLFREMADHPVLALVSDEL